MKKEAMLNLVIAARKARQMAEIVEQMLPNDGPGETLADTIYWRLADALFYICGEELQPDESVDESKTWKVLEDLSIREEDAAMILMEAAEKARKKESVSCSESISNIAEEIQNLRTWINNSANAMTAKDIEIRNLRETITDVARTTCLHCNAGKSSKCEHCNVKNWVRGEGR